MFLRFLGGGIGHRATHRSRVLSGALAATTDAASGSRIDDGGPVSHASMEEHLAVDLLEEGVPSRDTADIPHSEPEDNGADGDLDQDVPVSYDDGKDDYGYESSAASSNADTLDSDSEASGDGALMDFLGAEDGEDATAMDEDLEDSEGYAPF